MEAKAKSMCGAARTSEAALSSTDLKGAQKKMAVECLSSGAGEEADSESARLESTREEAGAASTMSSGVDT